MSDLTGISDERLFIRYAEGEGAAFRILMDRHAAGLLRYCRGYLSNEQDAEDAVQEAFIRAIRSSGTYRATHRFSTWLFTIARNICLDRLKARRRRAELREERQQRIAEATTGQLEVPGSSEGPEIPREALEAALHRLSPLAAETVRLTFFEEWTTRQIAELQGCAATTVRVRRHHALEKLRGLLERELDDGLLPETMRDREEREEREHHE